MAANLTAKVLGAQGDKIQGFLRRPEQLLQMILAAKAVAGQAVAVRTWLRRGVEASRSGTGSFGIGCWIERSGGGSSGRQPVGAADLAGYGGGGGHSGTVEGLAHRHRWWIGSCGSRAWRFRRC